MIDHIERYNKMKLKKGDTTESCKGIFISDGRILLVKPSGDGDHYDIPGGKRKFSESKEQGLYRECLEEINLRIKKAEFIGSDLERGKHYFIVSEWSGNMILQEEELRDYRWVPIGDVKDYYLTRTALNGYELFLTKI